MRSRRALALPLSLLPTCPPLPPTPPSPPPPTDPHPTTLALSPRPAPTRAARSSARTFLPFFRNVANASDPTAFRVLVSVKGPSFAYK